MSLLGRCNYFSKIFPSRLFILSIEGLHTSQIRYGTHDYQQEEFKFSQNSLQYVLENQKHIYDIRKTTKAVIRLAEHAESDDSGNTTNKFFVVGSATSRKYAIELLNEFMNERYPSSGKSISIKHDTKLLWHGYKRNYKGQYAPMKPRKKCIRCGGKMLSGNPCPLCQMKLNSNYEVDYTDVEILNQFICPHTWNILDPYKTNICKQQHLNIVKAVTKARNYGLIPFTLPLATDDPIKFKPVGIPTDRLIKMKVH